MFIGEGGCRRRGEKRVEKQHTHGSMIHPKVMNVHEYCLENLFVYFGEV